MSPSSLSPVANPLKKKQPWKLACSSLKEPDSEDNLRKTGAIRSLLSVCLLLDAGVVSAQTNSARLPAIAEFDHMQQHGFDWMLDYKGKSTADFVKGAHFADVDKNVISALKVQQDFDGPGTHVLLRDKFLEVLSGSGAGTRLPKAKWPGHWRAGARGRVRGADHQRTCPRTAVYLL